MKKYKSKVKAFPDQAIVILEKQKCDKNFTRYAKAILTERYLKDDVSLNELALKAKKTRSDFQKEILWDVITAKILVEKDIKQIIRIYSIIEKLPIDNLVKLTQESINPLVKEQVSKICYQKQLELEKALRLDEIDYNKYYQDDIEEFNEDKKNIKDKCKIPKKEQYDLSITTRKFLMSYYNLDYNEDKILTHKEMEDVLIKKGIVIPKRGRIQNISCGQVVTGEWILVRNENDKKRNARIIPYMNPVTSSIEKLANEMGIPYQKKRRENYDKYKRR